MGIYPTLNYVNHSCSHNATLCTPDAEPSTMQLVATQDIQASDQLTISYTGFVAEYEGGETEDLQLAEVLPVGARKQLLAEAYAFQCQCPACA